MSAIRISRPGHITHLIDQGPSVGRVTHARAAIMGGALVTASKPLPRIVPATTPQRRAQMAGYKAMKRDRCGHPMRPTGEPCARTKGHANLKDHKTAKQMERDSLRRRSVRHEGPLEEEAA